MYCEGEGWVKGVKDLMGIKVVSFIEFNFSKSAYFIILKLINKKTKTTKTAADLKSVEIVPQSMLQKIWILEYIYGDNSNFKKTSVVMYKNMFI